MKPKEKAKDLVRKFYSIGAIECKKCALIAVDEMIEETIIYPSLRKIYWERVKKEIEQL